MSRTENRVGKSKRASRACDNCRKRKIKCIGSFPCLNCITSGLKCSDRRQNQVSGERFFQSQTKLIYDVSSLKDSLTGFLDQLSTADSQELKNSLESAISALGNIDMESYTQMRYEAFEEYNCSKSIESEMVGKRNLLNRFEADGHFTSGVPINSFFGLYSPLICFSTVGISYMIRRLIRLRDDRSIRETIYLLMKFLDVSTMLYVRLNSSTNDTPRRPVDILAQLEEVLETLPLNIKDKLVGINRDRFNMPDEQLLVCVELFEKVQEAFAESLSDTSRLETYFETTETVSSLCREIFRSYTFGLIDVLSPDNLIKMIEQTYWTCHVASMGKIIAQTCRRLLDGGFNRWEYNLGLQEERGDRNRRLWWKGYWWDRWYAINTGKPPLLPDDQSSCLFPLDVLQLHVNDEMDCLTLAREADLNQASIDSCLQFGYILLGKTISFAFSSILYNGEFTSYRLHSNGGYRKSSVTLGNLRKHNDLLHETFRLIDDKLIPVLQANMQERRCLQLHVHSRMTVACISQALCSLFKRLEKCLASKQVSLLHRLTEQNETRLFDVSRMALLDSLKLNTVPLFVRSTVAIPTFMLNIVSHLISRGQDDQRGREKLLLDVSIMCAICERYDSFGDVAKIEPSGTNYMKYFIPLAAGSCFIFTRMCCQTYMGLHKRTEDQFLQDLKGMTTQRMEIAKKILEIRSPLFANLLKSYKRSWFTECILKHSRIKMDDLKVEVEVGQETNEKRTCNGADENFSSMNAIWPLNDADLNLLISSDSPLDLFDLFWDEAAARQFDYINQ
ncbi:hypothetical protein HG537_0H00130 [Torulaspora globosa]|uniref:Zn(2)-C6 fungal-type domain-containing protein n=1 Tax=Torulaspora globosa TaxID=48254 RepID=A0A7H9HQJ2_9SACH|nr:hypothetical protein HG537_0C06570 [Torulaspora sp. CBS 2947]QLQ82252.1 hypothetical protein HG537_0H00130 [Torulaspora sp. CBS 2947]